MHGERPICPEWDPFLSPSDIRLVGSSLFLLVKTGSADAQLLRISPSGSGELYATGFSDPRRMASDGKSIFITSYGSGEIRKVDIK